MHTWRVCSHGSHVITAGWLQRRCVRGSALSARPDPATRRGMYGGGVPAGVPPPLPPPGGPYKKRKEKKEPLLSLAIVERRFAFLDRDKSRSSSPSQSRLYARVRVVGLRVVKVQCNTAACYKNNRRTTVEITFMPLFCSFLLVVFLR